MYTISGTYNEVAALIVGYNLDRETPITSNEFRQFVCLKNGFPTNYSWESVIKECTKDDAEAIALMEKTIVEFVELGNRMTNDELLHFALECSETDEGEPEKLFRLFDQSLLTGDREIIESIIMDNADASILWQGAYPVDAAQRLNELVSSQSIKSIPLSEDGKSLKLIVAGWPFPIKMKEINGQWKINADQIIELRKSNTAKNPNS